MNPPTYTETPPFARRPEFSNPLRLYVASMGKIFKSECIARSMDEANEFCRKNPGHGVIAETSNGLVLCAELYGSRCPSALLES